MPARVRVPHRVVVHVRIPVQALRVGRVGHDAVRLDEAADGRGGPSPSTLQTSARTRLSSRPSSLSQGWEREEGKPVADGPGGG